MTSSQVLEPLGDVFTRRWVVDWMLDLAGYVPTEPLHDRTLVEPSCGGGAFLVPAVERLLGSCRSQGVTPTAAADAIHAIDIHQPSVDASRARVCEVLSSHGVDPDDARHLATRWVTRGDFLLVDDLPSADFVVGNPPYVRLEDVPEDLMNAYRSRWRTMTGRADLYVAFYERGLQLLAQDGKLAFICADRWMRNAYGRALRQMIDEENLAVDTVIRLHETDCFERDVSAYPAITVIRRGTQGDGVVVEVQKNFEPRHVDQIDLDDSEASADALWTTARIPGWFDPAMWPEGSPGELRRLAEYEKRFEVLEDVLRQTRVGIGVATGADEVYVTRDASLVEPERLLPLVMAEHIRDGTMKWTDRYLVNPWSARGLVDLAQSPKLAEYLASHQGQLRRRHVAQKQRARWYRTIDRVHLWLTNTPKILLADMKSRMTPVVDDGGFYPHHNLYWITSTVWDPYVLAGLLLSDHAELFVRSYCVKMRGGTLRMQAQYLRRIRVPHLNSAQVSPCTAVHVCQVSSSASTISTACIRRPATRSFFSKRRLSACPNTLIARSRKTMGGLVRLIWTSGSRRWVSRSSISRPSMGDSRQPAAPVRQCRVPAAT